MASYSTFNRFSLIQLYHEDRKQRAHLKKISDIQRHHGLDNRAPLRLPHLHQTFLKKLNEKRQEINQENEVKSKKILNIMGTIHVPPPPPFHPTNQIRHNHALHTNTEYRERITKIKGNYNAREWKKQYGQHKEYLRLTKDSKLFTPLDIGINRQRIIKVNSMMGSKHTTPNSSSSNMF
jgi:hypothetical protein